jgi:tRNA threonylcarbamoyladenosine biosynthesis protein TsaE
MTVRTSRSEHETEAIGRDVATSLEAGAIVLVAGPLGAGKTAFARGMARAFGANPDDVSSPTFTLLHEYPGRITFFHADLYRLTPREVEDLALAEVAAEGVLAVEWPERWLSAPADALRVEITPGDGDTRSIRIGLGGAN